jgi:hypothetical protein
MDNPQTLLTLALAAAGIGLAGILRIFAPRIEDLNFLRIGAMLLSLLAVLVGGLWLFAGSRNDQLQGSILMASGVVGLAVLAGPSSGCQRPPEATHSDE